MGNLPTYYMSLFKVHVGVIETLEKIRHGFLQGDGNEGNLKIRQVAWDKVVASKKKGGLGVRSMQSHNITLLTKWWQRLRTNPDSLWAGVIMGIHRLMNKLSNYLSCKSNVGVWNNIVGVKKDIQKFGLQVNNVTKKGGQIWE